MKQHFRGALSPTHGDPQESAGRESGRGLHHWVKVLLWACALGAVLLIVAQSLGAAQPADGFAFAGALRAR